MSGRRDLPHAPKRRPRGLGERRAIELLAGLLDTGRAAPGVALGIGDDAAILRRPPAKLVWTTDVAVENVHFRRGWLAWEDVGYRAFQAAVSDLAAMGARPLAALSSLVLPKGFGAAALAALGRGQAEAAARSRCPVVGGNISSGGELSITTSALGHARRPLCRCGARPGDELWLVGEVGLARAGLLLLERDARPKGAGARACVQAWRRPSALLRPGAALVGRAHAAIDVSDGLAGDAAQVAASCGCRLVIEAAALDRLLSPALLAAARELGQPARRLALQGGEDYALLAAGPPQRRPKSARRLGRVEAGSGVVHEAESGRAVRLAPGFEHRV